MCLVDVKEDDIYSVPPRRRRIREVRRSSYYSPPRRISPAPMRRIERTHYVRRPSDLPPPPPAPPSAAPPPSEPAPPPRPSEPPTEAPPPRYASKRMHWSALVGWRSFWTCNPELCFGELSLRQMPDRDRCMRQRFWGSMLICLTAKHPVARPSPRRRLRGMCSLTDVVLKWANIWDVALVRAQLTAGSAYE